MRPRSFHHCRLSQIAMSDESDKPSPVRVHIVVAGEEDGKSADDVHYCGKCKLVFTNIKDYLEHKVSHDSCQVTYTRSTKDKRMLVPNVHPKPIASKSSVSRDENAEKGDVEEKTIKRRGKREILDESLITQKFSYACSVCKQNFSRVAALKRHLEYDHELSEETDCTDQVTQTDSPQAKVEEDFQPSPKKARGNKNPSDKPFVCEFCGNKFKEAPVLKSHILTHTNKREFRCKVDGCNYAFKTKGSLTRHMRRHTGEKPYSCNLCGRTFSESGALTRHLKSRVSCKEKSDNDLPRYGKRWGFEAEAERREVLKQDVTINIGVVEQAMVEKEGALSEEEGGTPTLPEGAQVETVQNTQEGGPDTLHVDEGNGDTEEVETEVVETEVDNQDSLALVENGCRVCSMGFGSVEQLKNHLKLHLADAPVRCDDCHFVADSKEEFIQHKLNAHNKLTEEDLDCFTKKVPADVVDSEKKIMLAKLAVQQIIDITTEDLHTLDTVFNEGDKNQTTCPICQRTFRGQNYVIQHMKSHTGERPFKCLDCEKTFVCKDTLGKHMAVHNQDRQYKCGDCGKLFKRISHVREHLKIHTGDRPYQCGICSKTFRTANAAKVHSRTHGDVLPYKCLVCDRSFREKGSLQRHARMHTGEKPYKCQYCGRSFAEHGTLGRHLKAKVPCYRSIVTENDELLYPTVLAEFSSVVADTQQYIVQDKVTNGTADQESETTELVVVQASEIPVESFQNVEIVASGADGKAVVLSEVDGEAVVLSGVENFADGSQYLVLREEGGDNLHVLDQRTGETIATVPASLVNVSNKSEIDIESIEALIMAQENVTSEVVMNSVSSQDDFFTTAQQHEVVDTVTTEISSEDIHTTLEIDSAQTIPLIHEEKGEPSLPAYSELIPTSDQTVEITSKEEVIQTVEIKLNEEPVQTIIMVSESEETLQPQ